jgi:hypothetical protein
VILEYCDNDLNLYFKPLSPDEAREKYERVRQAAATRKSAFGSLKYLKEGLLFTFWAPYNDLKASIVRRELPSFASHYQPLISTLRQHDGLKDKRIIVFYINPHGRKFSAFPVGRDSQLPNVEFIDLNLGPSDFFTIDDHLTRQGHEHVARFLMDTIHHAPERR